MSCHRLAIKVALAQICGKDVADHVEIKKTEDGCAHLCCWSPP